MGCLPAGIWARPTLPSSSPAPTPAPAARTAPPCSRCRTTASRAWRPPPPTSAPCCTRPPGAGWAPRLVASPTTSGGSARREGLPAPTPRRPPSPRKPTVECEKRGAGSHRPLQRLRLPSAHKPCSQRWNQGSDAWPRWERGQEPWPPSPRPGQCTLAPSGARMVLLNTRAHQTPIPLTRHAFCAARRCMPGFCFCTLPH